MKPSLIILVTNYPYGYGEHFLENELKELIKQFENIYLIATDNNFSLSDVKIAYSPDEIKIFAYNEKITIKEKISVLKYFFNWYFYKDLFNVSTKLNTKITFKIIKILLFELLKASLLEKFIYKKIIENKIPIKNLFLYSYWNDFKSLAIANIKIKNPLIKAFSRAHGWDVYFERHPNKYLPMRGFIFEHLDAIFFISENGNRYTTDKFPECHASFITAKLGTVLTEKPDLKMNSGFVNLVSCSGVIPLKNISLIIDSLALINDIQINWTHIGDGSDKQAIEKYAKEKLADKKNISYTFLGFIHNHEVIKYYKNNIVDLFINTSLTEGIPVSIMEAVSFGIPIIAPDVGGISEIVLNNQNGYLLNNMPTPDHVAFALKKFYNLTYSEKIIFKENSYRIWEEKYNAEKNYIKFVEQILSL